VVSQTVLTIDRVAILSLQRPATVNRPTKIEYFPENHDIDDLWTPYPHRGEPVAAHTNCLKNGLFDQGLIMWELCDYLFGENKTIRVDPEIITNFHQRFEKWAENLPQCIKLGVASTPGAMEMQYVQPRSTRTMLTPQPACVITTQSWSCLASSRHL
jgi:hypothetical protein